MHLILHTMDHWTTFNIAFVYTFEKEGKPMVKVHDYVFPVFCLPAMSDNDKEFVLFKNS